jgi:hypothetical protein
MLAMEAKHPACNLQDARTGRTHGIGGSEIRLIRLRDWIKPLMEIVFVVFGANHFMERHFGRPMVDSVTLNRAPRHRKVAGVFDPDIHDHRLTIS